MKKKVLLFLRQGPLKIDAFFKPRFKNTNCKNAVPYTKMYYYDVSLMEPLVINNCAQTTAHTYLVKAARSLENVAN
jgi:hypothetical protein